jgi:hypothetical protein
MADTNATNAQTNTTTGKKGNPDSPENVMQKKAAETAAAGDYIFPTDLGRQYFEMNFVEFQPGGGNDPSQTATSMQVCLPFPASLTDVQGVTYNAAELGLLGKATAAIVGGMTGTIKEEGVTGTAIVAGAKKGVASLGADAAEMGKAMGLIALRKGTQAASAVVGALGGGDLAGGLALGLGTQLNPHLALIFQGVPLRTYTFTWKLAPQTYDENIVLLDMFKAIKARIHPVETLATLKFPDQVDCALKGSYHLGEHGEYIFKRAAITDLSMDYTPEGPSYFAKTGNPTLIGVSLTFQETEIHTREDYE